VIINTIVKDMEGQHRSYTAGNETRRWLDILRDLRPSGVKLFIGGPELWIYAQVWFFSSSFRLQAFGFVLLAYWILGALWCTRDRGEECEGGLTEGNPYFAPLGLEDGANGPIPRAAPWAVSLRPVGPEEKTAP
jgi:hypothetical protein